MFNERGDFRIRKLELKRIEKCIRENKDKYFSVSHFIRCAIIKLLKEERY